MAITFNAELIKLKSKVVLRLPEAASKQLSSRGQVAVVCSINGQSPNTIVLEPDGYWGHWMHADQGMIDAAGCKIGDSVEVEITPTKAWPEPKVPRDVQQALDAAPDKVKDKWRDITPMARWEWVRWISETKNSDTRRIRIEKSISKLNGTHRRPCCFNLAACTDPELSKSGRLIDPDLTT